MRNFTLNKCFITTIVALLFCSVLHAQSFEVDGVNYAVERDSSTPTVRVIPKSNGKYIGNVIIPSAVKYDNVIYDVKYIYSSAFSDCTCLTSIEIPNSVISILGGAFSGCTGLTSIQVDKDNKVYDSRGGCNAIVKTETNSLIAGCSTTVIPKGVTSIEYSAFSGCSGLTSIDIPNSVTVIGNYAFRGCTGLTFIKIPNSVTSIGQSAFSGSGLISIEIPNSVTSIGQSAFSDCAGITSITIPNSVTSMGESAFSNCVGLTSITIPNSVTFIGSSAFSGCAGLTSIQVDKDNKVYDSRDDCNAIIKTATNSLIAGCSITIIPKGVTSIEYGAFSGCTGLTSIEIPNSVTSIGSNAFSGCTGITSITTPNSVTSIGSNAFSGCTGITSITIPNSVTSIGSSVFSGCTGLTSVQVDKENKVYDSRGDCNAIIKTATNSLVAGCSTTIIPNSVTSIDGYSFKDCIRLMSIEIPNSVTKISDGAFENCKSMESIVLSSNIKLISKNTFSGCSSLFSINIPNGVTSIEDYAFKNCFNLESVEIPSSVSSISQNAFENTPWYNNQPDGILYINNIAYKYIGIMPDNTSVKLKKGTVSIANSAFNGCTGMTSIEIPNSVTSIGLYAFNGCINVKYVYWNARDVSESPGFCPSVENFIFGESVEKIPSNCCYGMSKLTSIEIPKTVTSIGQRAFSNCTGLTSIKIPNSVRSMGGSAFEDCTSLTTVYWNAEYCDCGLATRFKNCPIKKILFGESVRRIPSCCCEGVESLTYIEIPNGVTEIGNFAFRGCTGLTSIKIPNSVTSIPQDAFYNCTGLTSVYWDAENVSNYGQHTFEFCPIEKFIFGESVRKIPSYCCYNMKLLTSIEIPNSVTSIGEGAFSYTGLTSIRIPNSVTSIGQSAFYRSGLISIEIPNSVTSIGKQAFYGCAGLTSIEIPNSVRTLEDGIFYGCTGLKSIKIPNSVTSIGRTAFNNCTELISIEIPNSVSSVGDNAFQSCKNLSVVKWDAQNCKKVNSSMFNDCNIKEFIFGEVFNTIPSLYLENVTNIVSIDIPNTITSVESDAFKGCADLKEIITHTGMQIFEEGALNGCTGINLVFAEDVTNIEGNSCKNIEEISSVYIPHTVSKVGGYAFSNCKGLKNITCMSVTPPSTRFDVCTASEYENVILYVPCSSVEAYENDEHWGKFVQIRCVEAETVSGTVTTTTVTPSYNSASITWPAVPSASSYNISITINGNEYCTMVFNSNGQLVSVDFNEMSGSRSGQLRAAAQVGGYKFNVSGLAEGTEYGYVVVAQNSAGGEISRNTGTFRTLGIVEVEETLESDAKTLQDKVSVSGKLISLNDEKYSDMKIYNTVGQQVGNPVPASGVYIVTAGDDKIKVLVR